MCVVCIIDNGLGYKMRTKIKSIVFRQKRTKFRSALTFTNRWLLLEIIINSSSGEPQSRTFASFFVVTIFRSESCFYKYISEGLFVMFLSCWFLCFFLLFVLLFFFFFFFFFAYLTLSLIYFFFQDTASRLLDFRFISDTNRSMLFYSGDVFFQRQCHGSALR